MTALMAVGCTTTVTKGKAALPEGIEEAQLPDTEIGGFVYVNSNPPLKLSTSLFNPDSPNSNPDLGLRQATLYLGHTADDFGGKLAFVTEEDANTAWGFLQEASEDGAIWGKTASPTLTFANGVGEWSTSVRAALETDNNVNLPEYDEVSWNLLTNLPQNPPASPIAAGVIHLDGGLLEALADKANIEFEGFSEAFGLVRVNSAAFGVYSNVPLTVASQIDQQFLMESDTSLLMVSHSGYTGALVSFMVSVAADRTGMQLINFNGTNARYRTVGDLHLILKSKGSLVFVAMAPTQAQAQALMISALR